MASHELKTPVTIFSAFAQLLLTDEPLAGKAQPNGLLSRMNAQITKLTNLINDLLDLSKIEGNKLQYHFNYFDFNKMVQDVVDEMRLTTSGHTIDVKLVKSSNVVYGDRDRLIQVVANLLSNAIKYPGNSDNVKVSSTQNKQYVTVSVQDFGIGISKEKQHKISSRFFRVSGVEEDTYPGLGLGLYISNEIIKHHNGTIPVKCDKGKGSTFSIRLPLRKNDK